MKELREDKPGYVRVINPFPEDPEVTVEMEKLPQNRISKIWDLCGIRINAPEKNTMEKWDRANEMMIREQIKSWKGFTDHGQPVECNDETKRRALSSRYRSTNESGEMVRRPLWAILNDAFDAAEEADQKN